HGVLDQVASRIRQVGWNIKSITTHAYEGGTNVMELEIDVAHENFMRVMKNMTNLPCVVNITITQNGEKVVLRRPEMPHDAAIARENKTKAPLKKADVYRIMAINPGSTSTKFGIYDNDTCILTKTVRHDEELLAGCEKIFDQKELRVAGIKENLEAMGIPLTSLDAIAGRGGIVKPIESGVYIVNEELLEDCRTESAAMHASCLGAIIASEIAVPLGIPAFIVDPVVVYEMEPITRLSGLPGIERFSIFHALNQKAVARHIAAELGKPYENTRLIVAHMGGGFSVGAHRYGRVIDVSDGIAGEGPFTPERAGAIPVMPIIDMCYSGEYTREEMRQKIAGKGGVRAYLGTSDIEEVLRMINMGDEYAALVIDSMAYQTAKEIGSMVAVLEGRVDAIILTGGLAYSVRFTGAIKQRVDCFAPVHVYPGEDEIWALAGGVLRVLRGTEKAKQYI
ncbi:MAG: butyrate kinase, partial [Treponema sp.]|nr:butyrate kinase [Treponema sp.]